MNIVGTEKTTQKYLEMMQDWIFLITRGSWIRNNSPRTVTLDVTTYRGVSWNAVHYYGNIIIDGVSFSPAQILTLCVRKHMRLKRKIL